MTATDELRRMLDERGVEYEMRDGDTVKNTYWNCNGLRCGYTEDVGDNVIAENQMFLMVGSQLTFIPEQAIAATLGAGTCRWEYPQGANGWLGYMVCSGCGEKFDECVTDIAHYCPNCGRRVES